MDEILKLENLITAVSPLNIKAYIDSKNKQECTRDVITHNGSSNITITSLLLYGESAQHWHETHSRKKLEKTSLKNNALDL